MTGFELAAIILISVSILYIVRKWYRIRRGLSNLEQMAREAGAKDIKVDSKGRRVTFVMPSKTADDVLGKFEEALENDGVSMTVIRTEADSPQDDLQRGNKV